MPPRSSDMKTAIKEALKELLCDEEFMNKFLGKVNEKIAELVNTTCKQDKKIEQLEGRLENLQQAAKINNVCVHNLPEDENGNLTGKLLNFFNEKMTMHLTRQNIVKCYRVGKIKEKPRPVIIVFEQYQYKFNLLKNAYKLKGTRIGLSEDLNSSRLNLYIETMQQYGRNKVFTRFGNIFVRLENNKSKKISNPSDLMN